MNRPVKIVHFITDLKRGGEARLLLSLLPQYRQQGIDGMICCFSRNVHQDQMEEQDLVEEFEALGFRVVSLDATSRRIFQTVAAFHRLLRAERPDILHTYLFHPNVLGRVIGRITGVPVVVSSVVSVDDWKRPHHWLLERISSWFAHRILVNAQEVANQLALRDKVNRSKITVVYNGVDIERFRNASSTIREQLSWPEEAPIIGTVCRLHRAKGIEYLLEAFRMVLEQASEARLLIVGDGPLREELIERARSLGLENAVKFLGARDDIPEILGAVDIFAVSSIWEGIPGTIFEAMAAGVPIVATNVGGIPEVLTDGDNALLVNPEDPEALSHWIVQLLRNVEMAEKLTDRAYEDVCRHYSFRSMVDERVKFYRSLIEPAPVLGLTPRE